MRWLVDWAMQITLINVIKAQQRKAPSTADRRTSNHVAVRMRNEFRAAKIKFAIAADSARTARSSAGIEHSPMRTATQLCSSPITMNDDLTDNQKPQMLRSIRKKLNFPSFASFS